MMTHTRSPQNRFLFGERIRNWLTLPPEDWADLKIPAHLANQVFRISVARGPAAHYFELQVSEQCPKDTYSRLARCLAALKIQRLVLSITHARSAGVHLIFWRRLKREVYHHLDVLPVNPSGFELEILDGLKRPAPRRLDRLFDLMDGQCSSQTFFNLLREHLSEIPCKTETAYYAMMDLVLKLVFLIFVQRKGWLNFDPRYLENKMFLCQGKGLSLVTCFFKPLFAALDGRAGRAPIELGDLPHLGGGLFNFDPELLPSLPNDWLITLYQSLVSRYSFSLFEGREGRNILGVSPEVLGHVFENLLLGRERKDQGTYYTPMNVAEQQVVSALKAWRKHNCQSETAWRRALPRFRLLDPSCGSGTYLVAAFNILLKERLAHAPKCERYNGKLFALKRSIVLNNLYGVDIHPMAVKLTEVRLWLNMIQDLEIDEPASAPALPNLCHHLRPGDFLGRHLPGDVSLMGKWPKYPHLERLRNHFPHTRPKSRGVALRQIYRLERELAQWLLARVDARQHEALKQAMAQQTLPGQEAYADSYSLERNARHAEVWHVVFSKVFLEGGFHMILGNPPWLKSGKMEPGQKQAIQAYLNKPEGLTFSGQVDLSLYFMAAALELLKPGGHLSFLMPGKVLQAYYASSVRAWLGSRCSLDYLYDYGVDHNIIFQADTFPLVLGVSAKPPTADHEVQIERHTKDQVQSFRLPQSRLADHRGVWFTEEVRLPVGIKGWPCLLEKGVKIRRGIKTESKKHFTFEKPPGFLPGGRLRPLVRGRDIQRETIRPGALIYWPFNGRPDWFEGLPEAERGWLQKTGKLKSNGRKVWLPYRERVWGPWMLIWKYLGANWEVALVRAGTWVPDQTTYFINMPDFEQAYRYFAWFKTGIVKKLIQVLAERGKDRCFFFYAHTVASLPVPPDLDSRPLAIPQEREFLPGEGGNLWPAC